MRTFTLTGALTAVALVLALPGAVLAQQQATQPSVSDDEAAAGTRGEANTDENVQATPGAPSDQGAAQSTTGAGIPSGAAGGTSSSAGGMPLVGQPLYGSDGESFGEIDNVLLLDNEAYVMVDVGGFLGIGERRIAIPVDQIAVEGDRIVALGLVRQDLESLSEPEEPVEEQQLLPPGNGDSGDGDGDGAGDGGAAGGGSE